MCKTTDRNDILLGEIKLNYNPANTIEIKDTILYSTDKTIAEKLTIRTSKREGSLDANGQPLTKDGKPKKIHQFIKEM